MRPRLALPRRRVHPRRPRAPRAGSPGGALALLGVEAARGRRLDPDVEDLIAAFGNGFLVLMSIWLVTRDLDALGTLLFRQAAPLLGAQPADLLPLAAAPLLPPGRPAP